MGNNVHDIIKAERRKRGIPGFYWSREMARLAQYQADYCAKIGRLEHSERYAFEGGENLAQGGRNFPPRAVVSCWMRSKAGHREYLLSSRVTKAGVGIARRNGKTFVAWAFSDAPPSYPDCPFYKRRSFFSLRFPKVHFPKVRTRRYSMLRTAFGLIGLWLTLLGAHGLFVAASYWEALWSDFTGTADKLFFALPVPPWLGIHVYWMTNKGFQSWFIPLVVLVFGILLLHWTGFISMVMQRLQRSRLW